MCNKNKDLTKYHATCNLEEHHSRTADNTEKGKRFTHDFFCLDHQVVVSKDFWEWGWYGGTDNRALRK